METSRNDDFTIRPVPGPEIITESTRLEAGMATKLVLNTLSADTMIRMVVVVLMETWYK